MQNLNPSIETKQLIPINSVGLCHNDLHWDETNLQLYSI